MQKWILIFLLFKVSYSWTQTNSGTSIQRVPCSGTVSTDDIREDWRINMRHISTYFHNSELSIEEYKRLKDEANSVRLHPNVNQAISLRNSSQNDPVLASNFKGISEKIPYLWTILWLYLETDLWFRPLIEFNFYVARWYCDIF